MMMARDSTSGPQRLSTEILDTLRAALTAYVNTPGDGDSLRAALHSLADEARSKSILPERLLISLKEIWYSLPSVGATMDNDAQVRLLQRVVTMCIKEYYR
jgi:hypothetical protein